MNILHYYTLLATYLFVKYVIAMMTLHSVSVFQNKNCRSGSSDKGILAKTGLPNSP